MPENMQRPQQRLWQSARENGVSQILAPIAWVMLPSFMFQVSFEPVSKFWLFFSDPQMHNLPTRRKRRNPETDRQPPRTCNYSPAAASLSQATYRRHKYRLPMLSRWKRETNSTQGTEFLPHAMYMGLRKTTWRSAVDCGSPGRNREQKAQWNKEEYQKSGGRKQVVVETQWPQWITTFPTVIETICSLHTQLLTNSSF